MLGKSLYRKGGQTLEQAAQGGGGVANTGGVQKMCRCGTSGCGLADMVVLVSWFDFMILEVFSNLNDSMIISFFASKVCSCILIGRCPDVHLCQVQNEETRNLVTTFLAVFLASSFRMQNFFL